MAITKWAIDIAEAMGVTDPVAELTKLFKEVELLSCYDNTMTFRVNGLRIPDEDVPKSDDHEVWTRYEVMPDMWEPIPNTYEYKPCPNNGKIGYYLKNEQGLVMDSNHDPVLIWEDNHLINRPEGGKFLQLN